MTTTDTLQRAATQADRAIVHRTRGRGHGPVTRLMSPGDLGQLVKPFVFLDLFKKDGPAFGFGLHPHSGIATVTYVVEGAVNYIDPDGATGTIPAGGVEWMMAGKGMWHGGSIGEGPVAGFQLWLAMPPELELAPHQAAYVHADAVQTDGPARVLLGRQGEAKAEVEADLPITYLGVKLAAGETWRFTPPAGHSVLWIAVAEGTLSAPDAIEAGEMVVFDRSDGGITFTAQTAAHFVLGSSKPHEHDLAMGSYSVHTSPRALAEGEQHIDTLGEALRRQGRR